MLFKLDLLSDVFVFLLLISIFLLIIILQMIEERKKTRTIA